MRVCRLTDGDAGIMMVVTSINKSSAIWRKFWQKIIQKKIRFFVSRGRASWRAEKFIRSVIRGTHIRIFKTAVGCGWL